MDIHYYDANKDHDEIGIRDGYFVHKSCGGKNRNRHTWINPWGPIDVPRNAPHKDNTCAVCGQQFNPIQQNIELSQHFI